MHTSDCVTVSQGIMKVANIIQNILKFTVMLFQMEKTVLEVTVLLYQKEVAVCRGRECIFSNRIFWIYTSTCYFLVITMNKLSDLFKAQFPHL